jgi:WD40 repeat protein
LSPDGRWLVTGAGENIQNLPIQDNTARIWDMQDLSVEPIILRGHEDNLTSLTFSPDGHWLVTGSADATVRVWTMDVNALAELACQIAGRNLTQAEWAQYLPGTPYHQTCAQWPEGK